MSHITSQVRNYAAQAQYALLDMARRIRLAPRAKNLALDAERLEWLAKEIDRAVHFSLPMNGCLLDDALRGLSGIPTRLPYPCITISYASENLEGEDKNRTLSSSKRLLVAIEIDRNHAILKGADQELLDKLFVIDDKVIACFACCFMDDSNEWLPILSGALLSNEIPFNPVKNKRGHLSPLLPFCLIYFLPNVLDMFMENEIKDGHTLEDLTADLHKDIVDESRSALELCEALTCGNVASEIARHADSNVNARRIRDGKLPLYETRVLVINTPIGRSCGPDLGGTHSSPRQHLRRGHIRRLPTMNVWVNSCIVGNQDDGRIEKSYAVR